MIVMIIAITPSLKACTRPVPICLSWEDQAMDTLRPKTSCSGRGSADEPVRSGVYYAPHHKRETPIHAKIRGVRLECDFLCGVAAFRAGAFRRQHIEPSGGRDPDVARSASSDADLSRECDA